MNKLAALLVLCTVALAACQRNDSPVAATADVAAARAERQDEIMDARKVQAEVQADTAQAVVSIDPDARGQAIEDRARARYGTAIAQAKGDLDVATRACEALRGAARTACRSAAQSAYAAARSEAQLALDAERRRSQQTQRLDD